MSDVIDRAAEEILKRYPPFCPLSADGIAQILADAGALVTPEHDAQVRADEWAQLTEADFIAYGVERGWLSEETIPAFHGFGFTKPAVRRHVTVGEELPPDPEPTPEEIEALRRRLTGEGGPT